MQSMALLALAGAILGSFSVAAQADGARDFGTSSRDTSLVKIVVPDPTMARNPDGAVPSPMMNTRSQGAEAARGRDGIAVAIAGGSPWRIEDAAHAAATPASARAADVSRAAASRAPLAGPAIAAAATAPVDTARAVRTQNESAACCQGRGN